MRRSAFCHDTDFDHGGASVEEVTEDQTGSPDRERETTSQPRAAADLQMREPISSQLFEGQLILRIQIRVEQRTQEAVSPSYHDLLLGHHTDRAALVVENCNIIKCNRHHRVLEAWVTRER